MYELKGVVKDYAWGGYCYIPMILSQKAEGKPCAEYWLGEHPLGTAVTEDGKSLSEIIDSNPVKVLGQEICDCYKNRLPYLFKVLDVREPLSIQVHPTKEQAEIGYMREEQEHKAASLRNYKDDNHKPELMLALSDFYLLHGFANKDVALANLKRFDTLKSLYQYYQEKGLKEFVSYIFSQSKEALYEMLYPIVNDNTQAYNEGKISKADPLFWLVRAAIRAYECNQPLDAGLIMILIMNLMYVEKGQVVFQGAGVPHAYLEGQNIELMANSDNVIRGGLTPKLVDVKELLKIVKFDEITPKCIEPKHLEDGGLEFNVPVKDFKLTVYNLKKGQAFKLADTHTPNLWFVGSGEFSYNGKYLTQGSALFQALGEETNIVATSDVVLYKASAAL